MILANFALDARETAPPQVKLVGPIDKGVYAWSEGTASHATSQSQRIH